MKTNVAACSSVGSYFYSQIGRIYLDMLSMYRAASQMISESIAREGECYSDRCEEGMQRLNGFSQVPSPP